MLHEKCFPVIVLIASLNTSLKMIRKPVLTDWGCHLMFFTSWFFRAKLNYNSLENKSQQKRFKKTF